MRERRGGWVFVFLVVGMIGLFDVLLLSLAPLPGLLIAAIAWPVVAVAGLRIWQADHPGADPLAAVEARVKWIGSMVPALLVYGLLSGSLAMGIAVAVCVGIGILVFLGVAHFAMAGGALLDARTGAHEARADDNATDEPAPGSQ